MMIFTDSGALTMDMQDNIYATRLRIMDTTTVANLTRCYIPTNQTQELRNANTN